MRIAPRNEMVLTNIARMFSKRSGKVNVDRMFEEMGISGYRGGNKFEKTKAVLFDLYHRGEFDLLTNVLDRIRSDHLLPKDESDEFDALRSKLDLESGEWEPIVPEVKIPGFEVDTTEAREMAGPYIMLNILENELRKHVEKTLRAHFGTEWWEKGTSRSVKESHKRAKKKEEDSHWQPTKKISEIYYTDFSDIKKIISLNWGVFEKTFSNLNAVSQKLKELELVRNIIAHNRSLDEKEIHRLRLYTDDLLRSMRR